MLYLESFLHRVELAEIVSRWMINQPRPGDVPKLKTIVNFNSYLARMWVDRLAGQLLTAIYGKAPNSFVVKRKGQLKDFLVAHPLYTNPRIEEMIKRYKRFPEDFYRETPIDGRIYYNFENADPLYVGSSRLKRFRRIAEKGSRRIVDFMFERIQSHADDLAQERAARLGIPKSALITPPAQMVEEFQHAERRLLKSIKKRTIQAEMPVLAIPDVVGLKLVTEEDQYLRLLQALLDSTDSRLLEEELHSGPYNAINLRVAHYLPRQLLLDNPPTNAYLDVLAARGFQREAIAGMYQEFVESAEDHVLLEIIVSNFHELLESEIGRSMHEDRVLTQRTNQNYRSAIATAVRYLMDYMFTLCISPSHADVADVPIKLWAKYMPETMDTLIRGLFGVPTDSSFDALDAPHADDLSIPEFRPMQ